MKILNIYQESELLIFEFDQTLDNIKNVYIKNEFDEIMVLQSNIKNKFKINLNEVLEKFSQYDRETIFILLEKSDGITQSIQKINIKKYEYYIQNFETIINDDTTITPYITKNGIIQFTLKPELPISTYFARRHIDKIVINNKQAFLKGKFSIQNSTLEYAHLRITSRLSENIIEIPLEPTVFNVYKKLNSTSYDFEIDILNELKQYLENDFDSEDIIDIFLSIKVKEFKNVIDVKLGNPRIMVERFAKGEVSIDLGQTVKTAIPYFTMKGRNLSFRINEYAKEDYEAYKKLMHDYPTLIKNNLNKNKVWVIGEKSYKAQDNGYHFFKYMRTEHPNEEVYYVIDKNSEERKNVEPYGNVIDFKSKEHFEVMIKADVICSTHHTELLFPSHEASYVKKIRAKRVFLQHGVLGAKNLTQINGKQLKDFNVDMFITSSNREKQIVNRDLLFDSYQAKVTGLSRFDELFKENVEVKNQILIIPTWRDWITNINSLLESDYLQNYNDLLNRPEWKTIAQSKNVDIIFCLHPNMQAFVEYFDIPDYIKVIRQGEVDVQLLIKESKLMITDYSSVAFDFSFLEKPVIYYQFDRDRFIGRLPSHLDLDKELPGRIVDNVEAVIEAANHYVDNDFKNEQQIINKANNFVAYKDTNNSQRIYEEAKSFKRRNIIKDALKYDILSQHVFKRFRRHKKYFDIMSYMNKFLVRFGKIDEKLIVIESNLGKQVTDSPKMIYDQIKALDKGYKIVWVSNKIYPFDDENVITVKRLSPSYYKYLSLAKYWINNQNFPHYIEKKKNTTYIQTWHGTPLKKMLNDVDDFKGRDEGYIDRINRSVSRWDYLVSPSPYATSCFKSAFNFKKEMLEVGYPRNDIFYENESDIEEKQHIIKRKLSIPKDKKVILYAPTFRDDEVSSAKKHLINLKLDLHQMKEKLGDEYVLLLRPHIIISNNIIIDKSLEGFIYNVASYEDISDLYLISDICITDYSSVMFDYANTQKPLLFFTYDLEHYKDNLRGFYMNFEDEAPGPLLKDNESLIDAILNIETVNESYKDKYDKFYEKFCSFEKGTAAKQIVDKLF
ncbi:CDP-glycerol--glycerophosphate glycerophosphotransferase [Mammaliicoccus sciuri]|uniref:CDP-glycerol glycerophosphotransferase family protein n=1 Tax=Mammaliicoccus sciuri TaxID=1296 RepID=UPI000E69EFFB|nr:CDP-glycerol glycerophosphotransferase family protein [Mammaliicoccus sciuri]MEB6215252.1 CDP-glycerol glycerophosphotransferase family protein [Mammaliicoccus sciuri]MEB6255871.1 CDP-glycerol glycerophosphotransferase family protein [Mammaliicoccus sciuri]MEB6301335.1 CDP-glycerol glycerophosphotransferase family protein [Mammaliicoccus sciuri]MEB6330367.1 CDP-glycerol glycerophosphotransferase family protein [Mammaliicoccus sciuri]MEB7465388.1 CDP-glycerol glycerophosphotransferase family